MEDNNKNENNLNRGSLGVRFDENDTPEDNNRGSWTFTRKRSSLKPRTSIKPEETMTNKTFKKRITWTSEVLEDSTNQDPMSPEKYSQAKTHFSEVADESDLYLSKLNEINKIATTPEIIEEIRELAENSDDEKVSAQLKQKLLIEEKPEKYTTQNLPLQKRKSLKDEFIEIKKIKQDDDEELSADTIAETLKNTLYNKVVGKITDDD